jgi:acyl-CoA thioesterase-1
MNELQPTLLDRRICCLINRSLHAALFIALFLLYVIGYGSEAAAGDVTWKSAAPKQAAEKTIVALGDSLTAGLGVDETAAYPALLQRKLNGAGYHVNVVNAGISGETSSGTLSRIRWVISA